MSKLFNIRRFPSHEVHIGNRPMGANQPIRLQSMTNTDTMDVEATVNQSIRIFDAGADYVRISAPNVEAAYKLKDIKAALLAKGYDQPLIADIHFNAKVALVAAQYVEKVRINPGNYVRSTSKSQTQYTEEERLEELLQIKERLQPLVETCKQYNTAIRIGTNMGSLSPRIVARYGNTPQAMVMATFEFLEIFRQLEFHNLVISLKASKPLVMVQAYDGMTAKMLEHAMSYPIHIGITEAGEGENGRIKSALGIAALLNKGIGDTLRVSLSEDPEKEIPFANKLSAIYQPAFTASRSGIPYSPQPLNLSEKELSITDDNRKAIVIENLQTDITPSDPQPDPQPDMYFVDSTHPEPSLHDKQLLIAEGVAENFVQKNNFILRKCTGKPLEFKSNSAYALEICCTLDGEKFIPTGSSRPQAIVADISRCNETGNLDDIAAYCQKKEIPLIIRKKYLQAEWDDIICNTATLLSTLMMEKKIQGLWLEAPAMERSLAGMSFGFLQSAGIRVTRTEFISCPTCARTSFNLQKVLQEVQKHTSSIPGLKLAVMGCVVNGPGEMADADFGFVGAANGKLHIYKGKQPLLKNLETDIAVHKLLEILKNEGYELSQ